MTTTYTLEYDGHTFGLSSADFARLKKIYSSGLAISSTLFTFTPTDGDAEVILAVGSGAQFVLTANQDA